MSNTNSNACDEYLETWFAAQDAPATSPQAHDESAEAAAAHVEECAHCAQAAANIDKQALLLSAHFAELAVPSPPPLQPRAPLQAASGYPRRVSLNVLPFMLLLWLIGLLGVVALAWWVVSKFIE
ncbi:MAG: hypothetical protein AAF581_13375 [Planctomycetota bacterium]